MIIPEFEKLFEPYTEHGASLETTRAWLVKKAARMGIAEQIADQAIAETMIELAGGKTFFHKCECCDSEDAHNTIEHYMRDKMIDLHEKGLARMVEFLQNSIRVAMLEHMERENAKFTAKHMRPHWLRRMWERIWRREACRAEEEMQNAD